MLPRGQDVRREMRRLALPPADCRSPARSPPRPLRCLARPCAGDSAALAGYLPVPSPSPIFGCGNRHKKGSSAEVGVTERTPGDEPF
uniref:Uncharacterized protein n=1 Tax=Oryza meridionalis TaxID=40149 RepID=A0A0E0BZN4_9ORYZ